MPTSNSDILACAGVAVPTFGIRKNLGPNEIPYPELRVTVTNIYYNIFSFYTMFYGNKDESIPNAT